MTFHLDGDGWPIEWAPRSAGTFDQEPFDQWWPRVANDLGHLDPRVAEQWVFRHWDLSPYYGLNLTKLSSHIQQLSTSSILEDVRSDLYNEDKAEQPDLVWKLFNPKGVTPFEPARSMNATGTWNIPILVIRSDDGFSRGGSFLDARLWLIEGHQRLRYLRVLAAQRSAANVHDVLVLTAASRNRSVLTER